MTNETDKKANQKSRFIKAARELGCDEDEATFKAKLEQIARQKPKDETGATETAHKPEK